MPRASAWSKSRRTPGAPAKTLDGWARLGPRRTRSLGRLHGEHGTGEQRGIHAEPDGHCGKEPGDAEVEPVDGRNATPRARQHADRVGVHRGDAAAETLHDVEEAEAEAEAEIGRADDAEIEGAETQDL